MQKGCDKSGTPKIRKDVYIMKKRIADALKSRKRVTVLAGVLMAAIIGGSAYAGLVGSVPELTTNMDPVMEVSLEEEETPLAAKPKVTTKTSKKSSKKKVKLKKASKKTYSKKLPTKKKTSTKTKKTSSATVKTQTTVTTATVEKYTKKSKYKVVNKTVTTTVKTTTTQNATANKTNTSTSEGMAASTPKAPSKGSIDVMSAANKIDARVLKAYTTLGFTVSYDNSVSYAGYYDTRNRSITLRENDETIYHELGHFLAFIAGNADTSSSFVNVYNQEKGKYTGINKAYVTQNSSEYFAESVKDYTLDPSGLQNSRPETYKAIKAAMDKVTDAQITRIKLVYGRIWN